MDIAREWQVDDVRPAEGHGGLQVRLVGGDGEVCYLFAEDGTDIAAGDRAAVQVSVTRPEPPAEGA